VYGAGEMNQSIDSTRADFVRWVSERDAHAESNAHRNRPARRQTLFVCAYQFANTGKKPQNR
jgi:hypothetical protein